MKTVRVKTAELIHALTENKMKHKEDVVKATEGYQRSVLAAMDEVKTKIKSGKEFNLRKLHAMTPPISKVEEYDRALEMLNMSVDDVVEISETDFRCFVQDQWDWSHQALLSNTRYING